MITLHLPLPPSSHHRTHTISITFARSFWDSNSTSRSSQSTSAFSNSSNWSQRQNLSRLLLPIPIPIPIRTSCIFKSMDLDGGNKRVFHRPSGPGGGDSRHNKVCFHWQAGKCNRHPCPFLHSEPPPPNVNGTSSKRPYGSSENSGFSGPRRSSNFSTWGRGGGGGVAGGTRLVVRKADKICNYWVQGNCSYGERCKFLHSWSSGDGFSLLTQLEGHQKVKFSFSKELCYYRLLCLVT